MVRSIAKKALHYAILAAVLVGVPLLSCILAGKDSILSGVLEFPPRTEDFGSRVELLWNFRRPFRWGVFIGMVVFTLACLWPFVRRSVRAAFAARERKVAMSPRRFPAWGWLGVAILAAGWILSWTRFEWFRPFQVQCSYFPIWAGFIILMNALCVKRSGHSPMTDHPWAYAATFPASSLFWWFFEYLNRYGWNWYYLGIGELDAAEYTIYATVCFASVLPAVAAVAAWLRTFPAFGDEAFHGMARVDLRRPGWIVFLAALALAGLAGIVFLPDYTYLLLWISPLTMFVLVQFLLREKSVLDSLTRGDWSVFFRFAIASLVCGLCWETWNYYAYAKWVYAVPWVHRFQIWEMPLIGFAGYLPFGVECAAVTAWICPALVYGRDDVPGGDCRAGQGA